MENLFKTKDIRGEKNSNADFLHLLINIGTLVSFSFSKWN